MMSKKCGILVLCKTRNFHTRLLREEAMRVLDLTATLIYEIGEKQWYLPHVPLLKNKSSIAMSE
jgi:hypothetical protein